MPPRDGVYYAMDVRVICLLILGVFLVLCSASDLECKGYCDIFSNICKNGGTCQQNSPCSNTGFCSCPPNYEGEHCQKLIDPVEGDAKKEKKKPRRSKNNLILSLFRSLAVPRFGEKYSNHVGNRGTNENHKDNSGKIPRKQDTKTVKPSTTMSTTTTTTTPTTTNTPKTTTTTTTTSTTTKSTTTKATTTEMRTTTPTTIAIPVTTEMNSDEITNLFGESLLSSDDNFSAVSKETTTEGKMGELRISSKSTEGDNVLQKTGVITSNQGKGMSPTQTVFVHPTTSVIKSSDGKTNNQKPNKQIVTDLTGVQMSNSNQVKASVSPLISSSLGNDAKAERPQSSTQNNFASSSFTTTTEEIKKVERLSIQQTDFPKSVGSLHITNIITPSPVRSVSILKLPLIDVQKKDNPALGSKKTMDISSITTQRSESGENKQSTNQEPSQSRETNPSPSTAFSNVQRTTSVQSDNALAIKHDPKKKRNDISPSGSAFKTTVNVAEATTLGQQTNDKPDIVSTVHSVFPTDAVDTTPQGPTSKEKTTSLMDDVAKAVEKAIRDQSEESMDPVPSKETQGASTIDSTSASSPTAPPKQGSKLFDKITTLTNRLTKEFAKTLQKIISSVLTDPESSGTARPVTGKPEAHFDHIIPDTVNNLNQMDQHIIFNLKLMKKITDAKLSPTSLTPEKSTSNSGIKPTVGGERLHDSRTTSTGNILMSTSSSTQ